MGGDGEGFSLWGRRAGLIGLIIVAIWVGKGAIRALRPELVVAFLDVGQGKCILIVAPNGRCLIVDGGSHSFGREGWGKQIAYRVFLPALARLGVDAITAVLVTHPHEDHCNALPTVARELPISLFWRPFQESQDDDYLQLRGVMETKGVTIKRVRQGQRLWLDTHKGIVAEVISPPEGFFSRLREGDTNDSSAVVRLSFKGVRFLLTGDIGEGAQRWLLRSGIPLRATVLDVPHHGSLHNLPDFLEAVRPEVAVISAGRDNPFGHPDPKVIGWLRELGAKIWVTGTMGTLLVRTDGVRVRLEGWKGTGHGRVIR